jgi:hypothetical protein
MSEIISDLRVLTEAESSEWTLGNITFWDDTQLQNILDKHREDFTFQPLEAYPVYSTGGTLIYKEYEVEYKNIEQTTGGTAIFYVQDGNFDTAGTATWTADYRRGRIYFTDNQIGMVFYATGRAYDLNSAAAEVWRIKANHYATNFDFSTDNHSVKKSQVYDHCIERAEYFEGLSESSVVQAHISRSDDA